MPVLPARCPCKRTKEAGQRPASYWTDALREKRVASFIRFVSSGRNPRCASCCRRTRPYESPDLFSTYRELVLPEEADRYWKMAPAPAALNAIALRKALQG